LGSGDFSRDMLDILLGGGFALAAVITSPDRPAGRGLHPHSTPVKALAGEKGLAVLQPGNPREEGFLETLGGLHPDLMLVADYGHILPRPVLELPPRGCINVHPSLLPRYRGASPIRRALMDGLEVTGVTLMLMDEGMDTGPIISQTRLEVEETDDAGTLRGKLAALGARLVMEVVPRYASGGITPEPQDESLATHADPIAKSELEIDWSRPNQDIHNQVRALSPRPGAHTYLRGKRVKILRTGLRDNPEGLEAGAFIATNKTGLIAGTGRGALELEAIQPEGKKVMSAGEFTRGYRPRPGERFESRPA